MMKSLRLRFGRKKEAPSEKPPEEPLLKKGAAPCLVCGRDEYIPLPGKIQPDFDPAIYEDPSLKAAFLRRDNGICFNCGFIQSFFRPSRENLVKICQFGKDVTTSNTVFHHYPLPQDFRDDFNRRIFATRIERWREFFSNHRIRPTSSLFLRPFFGATALFVAREYGSKVAGVDISSVCTNTTCAEVPEYQALDGIINGIFEGSFLESGPYDAIFIFHVLPHSCDVISMLRQLRSLLREGGVIIFSGEIVRKLHNPFHMFHPSEVQLTWLLREYFPRVERIPRCQPSQTDNPIFIDGQEPDLIAWK